LKVCRPLVARYGLAQLRFLRCRCSWGPLSDYTIVDSLILENRDRCCLREEGHWPYQGQRCPYQSSPAWDPQIEDLWAYASSRQRQVRQREFTFQHKWNVVQSRLILKFLSYTHRLISELESRVVELLPRFTPSVRLSPRAWLLTTRNVSVTRLSLPCCVFQKILSGYLQFIVLLHIYCLFFRRRWWGFQERDQGDLHPVRQNPPRRRPSSLRAQEVRWPRCPRSLPEVLPLNYFWCMAV